VKINTPANPSATDGPSPRGTSERWIIHVDLDAFFASVEEILDPSVRGKAVIVGGDPAQRGVVSSASYPARACGVRSAMPMAQALRLCPHAVVITPRHHEYGRRSRAVMAILHEITPAMEPLSIDEAFLDVTGCERLWGAPVEIARLIQRRILQEQQLPCSLGIATNKLVAKVACDTGKPRGLVLVPAGEEAVFLAPLPIDRLWGVGRVTGERLRALGIETIGDLAGWPEEDLVRAFGDAGRHLYRAARGIDESRVQTGRERRSISQERTFGQDEGDQRVLERTLLSISEHVAARLREQRLVAETVRLKLRTPAFVTQTRQAALAQPTDQGQVIYATALQLLRDNWRQGQQLRLLGVAVSGLLDHSGYQLSLFDDSDQRRMRLNRALDEIRGRYGRDAITRASLLNPTGPEEGKEND
jgi:DNA polymerase IV